MQKRRTNVIVCNDYVAITSLFEHIDLLELNEYKQP